MSLHFDVWSARQLTNFTMTTINATCNCGNVLSSISIGFHKTTAIINCDAKIFFTQIVSTDFVFSTTRGAHSSFCSLRCSYYLLLDLLGPPSPTIAPTSHNNKLSTTHPTTMYGVWCMVYYGVYTELLSGITI